MADEPESADKAAAAGHYARKQIYSPSRLIAWAHRSRFETGLRLAKPFAGRKLLDLGCGDGTFLYFLFQKEWAPAAAIGAEIKDDLVEDCVERLGSVPNLDFVTVDSLDQEDHRGAYDAVFCMEVIEHVIDVDTLLDQIRFLLSANGRAVISVPVEIGLPLLVKQTARTVAGWAGIGDYPGTTPYTLRELGASVFAGNRQHIERPIHQGEGEQPFHDHKGFNWKELRERIKSRFDVESVSASPISWLPPQLGSQCWFVLVPKNTLEAGTN